MRRLTIFTAAALAVASIGCDTATNTANVNANRVMNSNSNVAVVVNNNANVMMNSNMSSNNRYNANMTREEYERNRADYDRDRTGSTIGTGANDSWLWFKTRAALLATDELRESTINVDVANDVITLRGTVENAAQKAKAESVAKGIEGQKGIKNQLTVQAGDSMTNQMTGSNANTMRTNTTNANRR